MRTQTLQAPMQVVQMTGDVLVVLANGATRPLLPGEVLPAGTTLQLADDATLQLAPPDGSAPTDTANAAPAGDAVPPPATTGVGAEVAAIQQALLEGVDPTLTLEATAAGGAPAAGGGGAGGSGNGGFVSIDRTGDSTLAAAGFDTTYQAGATTDVPNPVAATVVDVPAPVITPDGSSVSEGNLNTGNQLDTDLVDGTQAGQGSTTVQGNLNVDFGGATGSVSFLPVETQPALTSGGQPLVWAVSDDGLTLTGSVNGTVIMTVTLAADGSSYTVDLDGALDNGADPLAIAIGIQAQNDAGAITSGQIVLTVADDAPLAQDDALSVGEDDTTTVTGNVLVNDQVGADGAVVTAQTVTNELGSLVLGTDGQYSFTLNNSNPSVQALTEGETLTQVYSYTLTDADGDTSTANLTITITGSDDGIVITDLTPAGEGGEGVVFEDDLANGSDASKEPLSVNGTFSVSAPDGLQSITIGGVVVTLAQLQDAAANPVALSSGLGNSLTITGFSDGVVSYTYTLLGNEAHPDTGNDVLLDNTSILVTDRDGDTASSNLSIQIVDDVPTAVADSASIAEDAELLTIEGNVLTSDTQGADGAVVTPQTVESALGTLELESNGEYSFTLNNSNPSVQALTEGETLTQVYSYTLTDADGDTSTANLTITITGSDDGIVITDLTPAGEGGEGVVFEDDLANGSDASKEPLSVNGTFSVSAPDGLQSITIGGVVVTLAQLQDAAANPVALSSGLGNSLTITGFSDGVVSYTYTLLGNEAHPDTGNDVLLDNTSILVTDRDGDTASSNLSIQIVDDVPTAVADSASIAEDAELLTIEGNVLTSDTQGADGAVVTPQTVESALGTLELESNGEYSFTLNNSNPSVQALTEGETLTQVYSYTLTDADGDTSTANLTITITGSDDGIVITDLTPAGEGGEGVVFEDDLANGSDASKEPLSVNGTFSVSAPDGLQSITIGGVVVTLAQLQDAAANPVALSSGLGNSLTITGFSDGVVSYTYTLLGNEAHPDTGNDVLLDNTSILVTDRDGDTASSNLSIQIVDDVPTAVADSASIAEDAELLTIEGNVLTSDTQGADGAVVTPQTVEDALGTLVLGSDGEYRFTLNNSNPAVQALGEGETLTQVYSYTLTDGDGDTSTANLTITITGSDDGIVIIDLTPSTQGGEGVVFEDDLSDGSDTSKEPLSVDGTFSVSAPDGLQSITIGGVVVTLAQLQDAAANPVALSSALGNSLTITGFSDGVVSYTYTLLDNETHPAAGNDGLFDNTTVVVTDRDGDTVSSTLSIQIVDDVPTAVADSASIAEDAELLTIEGNVLTSDTQGADGATVTPQTVESALGTLELGSDGEYRFTLNNSNPAVQALGEGETLTQVYSYTLTDGDGDTSTANLTITITGSDDGIVIIDLTPSTQGGEGVVFEDDLSDGSDASKEPLSVDGTFSVSAPDGLQSITIGGVVVTLAQLQDAAANPVVLSSALGNSLTITGFSDGVVSYTYTLLGNEAHPDTGNDVLLDNTSILVTDRDGDTASSNLSIQIVDDVPTAVADSASIAEDAELLTIEGNVLTSDTQGADGAVVTPQTVESALGTLELESNGEYSFTLNNSNPSVQALTEGETLTQVYSYTLTDGDGDTSTANLTITITGSDDGIVIIDLTPSTQGGEGVVFEDDLSDGSDTSKEPLSVDGTFSVSAPDGLQSITIGGVVVTLAQLKDAAANPVVLSSALGNSLTITGFSDGVVSYTYTLLGNEAHPDAGNDVLLDNTSILVTDRDGDTASSNLSIQIVDDVPEISIAATPNTVVEGESLTTGTWSLNAGADGATVAVIVGGVSYALGEEIDTGKGLLTVANDGTWSFVAADDLDNTDPQTVSFTLKATDGDQDVDEATQTITITDGDGPTWGGEVNSANLTVDEAALSVLGGDTGTDPSSLAETDSSGTLQFKAGSDAIDSIVFGDPSGISIAGIDTNNIVWTLSPNGRTLTGAVGSEDVLKLTLDGASSVAVDGIGNVTVKAELLGNLLHQDDPNAGSLVVSGITVVGADDDGDSLTADVSVTVNDDTPTVSENATVLLDDDALTGGNAAGVGDDADAAHVSGTLGHSFGADGGSIAWATTGAPSGFSYVPDEADATVLYILQGETRVMTLTLDPATGGYTVTQNAPIDHALGGNENNAEFSVGYVVTDGDGDTATGSLGINVDDDTPTVSENATVLLDDDALTGGNAAGVGDDADAAHVSGTLGHSFGADGGSIAWAITGAPSGFSYVPDEADATVLYILQGETRVMTLTLDPATGGYTVTQNAPIDHALGGNENNAEFSVGYVVTDGDGDTATGSLGINVDDDTPTVSENATVLLDDDALTGGNAAGVGDDADAAHVSGTLGHSFGADGGSIAWATTGAPSGFSYVPDEADATVLYILQGETRVMTLTLDPATGGYTVTQNAPIDHALGGNENNAEFSVGYVVTDGDGDTATGSLGINVDDDTPTLTSINDAEVLNSDAGFATGSSVLNLGADQPAMGDLTGNIPGWDGTTVTYAQSSLTSNEKPVYFFVDPNNPETLFAYTSETAGAYNPDSLTQSLIFTLDYQESGNYTLTMDGKLDAPTQEFGASFSTTIGGNQDYLVVTDTGDIYKPGDTIPSSQTVVMTIDSDPGVTVNSSQQGLGADGQWIEGDAVINFNFTTPVVSAEFKIDIQSVNPGKGSNDVDWVVHGTDANGNLVTESGTTPFTDGVMTQIPTTLTHITKVELSDHSGLEGNSFRVSGYEVVDRIDEEPFDKSFVVGVTDADGDTANGQLTVTFNPDGDSQLLVGSNANDVTGSSARFITTADAGAIAAGSGDDILVGDEGRSSLVGKSVNLILMLDTSGSMDSKISFDGGHNNMTRLEAMQDAVNNLLANLAGGAAARVRVHIIDFDSTATSLGSFDVKNGELAAAEQAVNQLREGGITNYEAALQAALNWLGSSGSDAPLTGSNVINQAIFISDGQPNSWLIGNSSDLANYKHPDGSKAEALKQILGLSGSDDGNEVALLEQLFAQIQAIGINVGANDLNVLNQVEGELANVNPDAATNITTAQQLNDVLANLDPSLVLRDAGNDELSGGGGNDLLFGDAPFTDTLAHNAGLMLAAGAGWQVFSELEAGHSTVDGYDHWTRADTVAYIQDHAEELAQESGRNLGNDILDGGAGNDYLFGQEGDDQLDGGVGNDQLYGGSGSDEMTGGNGNDVFVWLKGDADKSTDTITDFTIGHDKLDLADVLNDPTGNLSNYLSVTGSGDDALVKVYSAGNASGGGTADLTIVLDGLASTSTELQQLQDYLLNQDGVIK